MDDDFKLFWWLGEGGRTYNICICHFQVVSPNIYNSRLWQTSGHWDHYADNMFRFEVEKEKFGLKPMNCPGHCLIFDHGIRFTLKSYKSHFVVNFCSVVYKLHYSI